MKLKFGMVGGGNKAFIGNVHRRGATMDNLSELICGCFTRNKEQNQLTAKEWGIKDESRIYDSYIEMAEKEAKRPDPIDFICIVTPNSTHFEIAKLFLSKGFNLICDKPVTMNVEQGMELIALKEKMNVFFAVTFTYSGYAMIRQARYMIENDVIGEITNVMIEYPQDWLSVALESEQSDQAMWRLNPEIAGNSQCCADIGTHIEYLAESMTGLKLTHVLARFDKIPDSLDLESNIHVLMRYSDGKNHNISGNLWASQIAIGHDCDIRIRVYGTKGSIEWCQNQLDKIKVCLINQPIQIYTVNKKYINQSSKFYSRLPSGHPEGYYEAFGNIYKGFCTHILAKKNGNVIEKPWYPTLEDGVKRVRFVEACILSNQKDNVWVLV